MANEVNCGNGTERGRRTNSFRAFLQNRKVRVAILPEG
jgi:hypothetical protein